MSDRRGQATVEWMAMLLVTVVLALGVMAGVRGALPRGEALSRDLAAVASAGFAPATTPTPLPIGDGAPLPPVDGGSIVDIARRLASAGIEEVPPGSNRGAAVDVFTDGNAEAWCADFVSWVLRAAGRPFTGGASGWRLAWTGDVRAWFTARAAFRERIVADPHPGDVVWFVHGHVGIVEEIRGAALVTIEGNSSNAVTRRVYDHWRGNVDIGGFGRPGVSARLPLSTS